jgi:hypothetical protein
MPRGWLALLWLFLIGWEPMKLARELTTSLDSLGMRGPAAVIELLAHAAVAALAMAAGWALSNGTPHGPRLARLAVPLSAVSAVQSLYWSTLPSQTMPGDKGPLAALAIANALLWTAYLWMSRRVRAIEN